NAGLGEIVPIFDALGISLAHEENNRGGEGRTVVGEAFLPVLGNQMPILIKNIDVVSQRKGDDVGRQAVENGAGLFAGTAVGLFDDDRVAGFLLPVAGERRVECLIELTRWIIRSVEQGNAFCLEER